MKLFALRITVLLFAILPLAARAHHAFEVYYDVSEAAIETYQGSVKKLTLPSPHSYMVVTVEQNNSTKDWVLEAPSGMLLNRWGWPLDDFETGRAITFTGYPARNGDTAMRLLNIRFMGREHCAYACVADPRM